MSSIRYSDRWIFASALQGMLFVWAGAVVLAIILLLGLLLDQPGLTATVRGLGHLLPGDLLRWPIYTT